MVTVKCRNESGSEWDQEYSPQHREWYSCKVEVLENDCREFPPACLPTDKPLNDPGQFVRLVEAFLACT